MSTTTSTNTEDLTRENVEANRYALFAKLRELWKQAGQDEERTSQALADHLGVPKQRITQWATGSGSKAPAPWHVIMRLCGELGFGVALHPFEGAKLYRLQNEKAV